MQAVSDIEPIPELFRDDADLLITFLTGDGVEFTSSNNDPWYRGMVPGANWSSGFSDETFPGWYPEEAASPLGCLQRWQFCNANEDHCGPFKGFIDVQIQSAHLFNLSEEADLVSTVGASDNANPVGDRFLWFISITALVASDVAGIVTQLASFSLSSRQNMVEGFMGPLPDNQWQLDVEHWFATWLAAMQASVVNVAVGVGDEALRPYAIAPNSTYVQESMCKSQVSAPHGDFYHFRKALSTRRPSSVSDSLRSNRLF